MLSDIYWINDSKIGEKKMGTMARPRGNDWLENEIKGLKNRGVDFVISLLENSEEWELDLEQEEGLCKEQGIEFINFPIRDVAIPENEADFIELVRFLSNQIRQNKRLVIHCRMGIGRSSLLTASIMINLGFNGSEVFEIIEKYRKMRVPDTEEQKNWVLSLENRLK